MMKCIVSDFDGTLYDNTLEYNIEKINEFIQNGNCFVLATGRTFKSIKDVIEKYNIKYSYLICSDGTCIYDTNNKIIYNKFMNNYTKERVLNTILTINKQVEIKYDNNYDICDNAEMISRILINADIETKKDLMNLLNRNDDIFVYLSTNWINISSSDANKLFAIKYLEKINNFSNVYVIGNDINDYAMIDYYNGFLINRDIKSFKEFLTKINTD